MIEAKNNSNLPKTKTQVFLEYVLLALCLCVIAVRTTLTEALNPQAAAQSVSLADSVYSLSISAILIFAFLLWLVLASCSSRFSYRLTGIEIGLLIFTIAAVIAGLVASNKRAAITDFAVLAAPLLMALLLVQILDSPQKIKLVLIVIAALGIVSAFQCVDQFLVSNQAMIDQYEQAPQTLLEPLGIQPGSFAQMLFEHRLYTKGIRGFFTTGNSAGSFAILASFAAVALLIEKLKNKRSDTPQSFDLILTGLASAAVISGLAITKSKGTIAASLLAASMFITYLLFGSRLNKHKKAIFIILLLSALTAVTAVTLYGLTHGRLPGGNSLLVRWQYWCASARMAEDHPLTGIGPGNFVDFYPHYKAPEALESVSDPHNFPLSILTQYGPFGLVGFLALFSVPLYRILLPNPALQNQRYTTSRLPVIFALIIAAAMLLARPIIIPLAPCDTLTVKIYVIFSLYIAPVVAFVIGLALFTDRDKTDKIPSTNITSAALFCAVVGVLVHNLIDFAIFEPPVFTALCAILAVLIALNKPPQLTLTLRPPAKVFIITAALALAWTCLNYAFTPVVKSASRIRQANRSISLGQFEQAHNLLSAAEKIDPLCPLPSALNSRLYLQQFYASGSHQKDLLRNAEKSLNNAIARSPADFKNFERLAEVCSSLAEISTPQEKTALLNKAFDTTLLALRLYPGCDRLHFRLAQLAELLGKTNIALEHYQKTVDIEDKYRAQFRVMYPGRKIFSRLGQEKYQTAKQQIKILLELKNR